MPARNTHVHGMNELINIVEHTQTHIIVCRGTPESGDPIEIEIIKVNFETVFIALQKNFRPEKYGAMHWSYRKIGRAGKIDIHAKCVRIKLCCITLKMSRGHSDICGCVMCRYTLYSCIK